MKRVMLPRQQCKKKFTGEIEIKEENIYTKGIMSKADYCALCIDQKEILLGRIREWSDILEFEDLKNLLTSLIQIWNYSYKQNRNNWHDYDAMALCAFEICCSGYKDKDAMHRLEWCHRIQNSLDNNDTRIGWRVGFENEESGRYYYINEHERQRRIVRFIKD
jgi:hypothetical protein